MRAATPVRPLAQTVGDLGLPDNHEIVKTPGKALYARDIGELAAAGSAFANARVALSFRDSFECIRAMLALDGWAEALMPLAPDLPGEAVEQLAAAADVHRLLGDRDDLFGKLRRCGLSMDKPEKPQDLPQRLTWWLLTTSGSTGLPKIVCHERASILRSVRCSRDGRAARWAMLYDPGRFAGTQVLAQALLTGGTLLVPEPDMSAGSMIEWLAEEKCTHISATPSMWRRILMSPVADRLPLQQVTLGGEIADQTVLAALQMRFPAARITHIYASTEAGSGFAVRDGRPGFPAQWLTDGVDGTDLSVRDGILWLRPPQPMLARAAYIVRDVDGYIRSGDRVAVEGDRVLFLGREDATLNVGGVKVQLEAVEEVVNAHPAVARCRIGARPSAMMGNLLTLSVVPRGENPDGAALRRDIAQWCRDKLPPPARPATIHVVSDLPITAAGKLSRVETP